MGGAARGECGRGAARGECGRGAARGECGENVESFCSRGRSAYVGFSCLFLLAPVRGGTSFLFKREKKRSKETRFKPPIFKCRRCSFQVFGTNVARPPTTQPAVEHPPQAPAARTRFASTALFLATAGLWHERSAAPHINPQSNTPSSTSGAHTLRPNGRISGMTCFLLMPPQWYAPIRYGSCFARLIRCLSLTGFRLTLTGQASPA